MVRGLSAARASVSKLGGALLLGSAVLGFVPSPVAGQNDCGLEYALLWRAVAQDTPSETHFFTRVTFSCDDGTIIYADSAIVSPNQRLSQWFGNVSFNEEGRELLADRATYRSDIDRLDAFGNVSLIDTTGSELEGENLVYIRDAENQKNAHLTMTGLAGAQPRARIIPGQSGADSSEATVDSVPEPVDGSVLPPDSVPPDTVGVAMPITPVPDTLVIDTLVPDAPVPDTVPPEPAVPYEVTADRIIIEGSSTFRGEGNVEVNRESLHATGRNMVYESAQGELLMAGDARSEGEGYDLTANAITVVLPNDKVEAIVARGDAALTTDDLDLTAPKIQIFVDTEKLQRLVAAPMGPDDTPAAPQTPESGGEGATRATALTQDFLLYGDSLDVMTPGEVLERVTAIGGARGEAIGQDTLGQVDTPELARNDWLEGDTIVATFIPNESDSVAPQRIQPVETPVDTSALAGFQAVPQVLEEPAPAPARERYRLDRLVALGNAKSLYRMAPSDTTGTVEPGRVALHYVVGDGITILMLDGAVDRMEVSGQTQGFHLEPVARTRAGDSIVADSAALDSLGTDSLAVDTLPADTLPATLPQIDTLPRDATRSSGWGQSADLWVTRRLTVWAEPARRLAATTPYRPSRRTFWPTH